LRRLSHEIPEERGKIERLNPFNDAVKKYYPLTETKLFETWNQMNFSVKGLADMSEKVAHSRDSSDSEKINGFAIKKPTSTELDILSHFFNPINLENESADSNKLKELSQDLNERFNNGVAFIKGKTNLILHNLFEHYNEHKIESDYSIIEQVSDRERQWLNQVKSLERYPVVEKVLDNENLPLSDYAFVEFENPDEDAVAVYAHHQAFLGVNIENDHIQTLIDLEENSWFLFADILGHEKAHGKEGPHWTTEFKDYRDKLSRAYRTAAMQRLNEKLES